MSKPCISFLASSLRAESPISILNNNDDLKAPTTHVIIYMPLVDVTTVIHLTYSSLTLQPTDLVTP